jgi:hypothetical protein
MSSLFFIKPCMPLALLSMKLYTLRPPNKTPDRSPALLSGKKIQLNEDSACGT